jgi:hypothetical protein
MAKAPSLAARLAAVAAQPTGAGYPTAAPANQEALTATETAYSAAPPQEVGPSAYPAAASYAPPNFALPQAAKPKARDGRVMVAGYFSPELSRSLRILAAERDVTIQHLVGEGLDFVLRHYGKHPMGER